MSATKNTDSIQPGQQFSSRPDNRETEDTPKHQPGTHPTPKDQAPENTVKVLPPGTAPPSKTYTPNPDPTAQASGASAATSAADTLGGATSADVNAGLGKPMQGQTSNELRHEGQQQGGNKEGKGLVGVGASGAPSGLKQVDPHDPDMAGQRALGKEDAKIGGSGQPSAGERLPVGAEEVASERK